MAQPSGSRSPTHTPIAPVLRGEVLTALELRPNGLANSVADRLATLTARAAGARSAMIHLVEGRHMRLLGGHEPPEGFTRMDAVPASVTLAGLVVHYGFPPAIEDLDTDPRVPAEAPARAVGIRANAGFPVRDPTGEIVGVCAVMDYQPRHWQAPSWLRSTRRRRSAPPWSRNARPGARSTANAPS